VARASSSSPKLPAGRRLRVAVVGGGPAGGAAAEALAKGGVETVLIERKMDNCKPCGGAIPLCMVSEFDLPLDLVDRIAGIDGVVSVADGLRRTDCPIAPELFRLVG
jgi:geranylgeranyl reductase